MIKINLLPEEIVRRQRLIDERKTLIIGAVGLYALLGLIALIFVGLWAGQVGRESSLANKKKGLGEIAKKMIEIEELEDKIKYNTRFSVELIKNRVKWTEVMEELFVNTPKDVWYNKIYFQNRIKGDFAKKGKFDLEGYIEKSKKDTALKFADQLKAKTKYFNRAYYDGAFEGEIKFQPNSKKSFVRFKIASGR